MSLVDIIIDLITVSFHREVLDLKSDQLLSFNYKRKDQQPSKPATSVSPTFASKNTRKFTLFECPVLR